jgi:predicted Zn finger-like uncharacterized protein
MYAMTTSDLNEHPQTCCSNCHTVFEVSAELLESSDTRVRCGECLSIFDALINLRREDNFSEDDDFEVDTDGNVVDQEGAADDQVDIVIAAKDDEIGADYQKQSELNDAGEAALAGLHNDTAPLDVTFTDFSLFSEDADLPEVPYFDQTRDSGGFEDDDDEYEKDETFSDTLFSQDMTIDLPGPEEDQPSLNGMTAVALSKDVDFVTNDSQRDPIVFKYRDKEPAAEPVKDSVLEIDAMIERVRSGVSRSTVAVPEIVQERSPWVVRSSMIALVVLFAALLYGFKERSNLLNIPVVRPVLAGLCTVLPCDVPAHVDVAAFKTVKRAAFSHPNVQNALIIDLAFINEAAFSQPHPVLELKLTDITGRLVVKNKFSPSDYLDSWQDGDQLGSGERLNVSLTVEDPGRDVTSFMVAFH